MPAPAVCAAAPPMAALRAQSFGAGVFVPEPTVRLLAANR